MLLDLHSVHVVNREHPYIHKYIAESDAVPAVKDILDKQYEDAVEELRVAYRKVLDKMEHAMRLACQNALDPDVDDLIAGAGLQKES